MAAPAREDPAGPPRERSRRPPRGASSTAARSSSTPVGTITWASTPGPPPHPASWVRVSPGGPRPGATRGSDSDMHRQRKQHQPRHGDQRQHTVGEDDLLRGLTGPGADEYAVAQNAGGERDGSEQPPGDAVHSG